MSENQVQELKSSSVTDEHMHNYIYGYLCARESVRARTRRSARARERRERVMTGDDAGLFCGLKGTRREIILFYQVNVRVHDVRVLIITGPYS